MYDWFKTMKYSIRCIKDSQSTGVDDVGEGAPNNFEILQNYPNPFNPSTMIAFNLPEISNVAINIFDVLGRKIHTLLNEKLAAGTHKINFNTQLVAGNLPSGMYVYKIQTPKYTGSGKMLLLK